MCLEGKFLRKQLDLNEVSMWQSYSGTALIRRYRDSELIVIPSCEESRKIVFTRTWPFNTVISEFPASRTVKDKCCWLRQSILFMLSQLKVIKTVLCLFARVAIAKYHGLSGLNYRSLFSHSSGS